MPRVLLQGRPTGALRGHEVSRREASAKADGTAVGLVGEVESRRRGNSGHPQAGAGRDGSSEAGKASGTLRSVQVKEQAKEALPVSKMSEGLLEVGGGRGFAVHLQEVSRVLREVNRISWGGQTVDKESDVLVTGDGRGDVSDAILNTVT